jgi:hypothetical protein
VQVVDKSRERCMSVVDGVMLLIGNPPSTSATTYASTYGMRTRHVVGSTVLRNRERPLASVHRLRHETPIPKGSRRARDLHRRESGRIRLRNWSFHEPSISRSRCSRHSVSRIIPFWIAWKPIGMRHSTPSAINEFASSLHLSGQDMWSRPATTPPYTPPYAPPLG